MHDWNDCDFLYWQRIDNACNTIEFISNTFGRFGGQVKEKFGTVRFYARFHSQLHDLFYPRHYYIRWGRFGQFLDDVYMRTVAKYTTPAIHVWQHFVYRWAYKIAAIRNPMIYNEIYSMADHHELLTKDYPAYDKKA